MAINPNLQAEFDLKMMAKAIVLAKKGQYSTKPNPAVGCVITQGLDIISTGWHKQAGQAHAELDAITNCQASLVGATVYVTLEPCSHIGLTPPCADLLIKTGVARVVIAMQDPNPLVSGKGVRKLIDANISVSMGLLEQEAKAINTGFIYSMLHKKPFVRLKIASSLDGRTAMESGESNWITGKESREQVHIMRAQHGALITGIGTVLADDPSLNVRLSADKLAEMNLTEENCQPIRVVLDANLSMPVDAKMLSLPGRTIIVTSKQTAEDSGPVIETLYQAGAEVVAVAADAEKLDIESVLDYLHNVEKVREVMVEAGAIVAGAFIQSGFVQEVHAYIAPILMGTTAKPMFAIDDINSMNDKISFKFQKVETVGDDLHLVLIPSMENSNENN